MKVFLLAVFLCAAVARGFVPSHRTGARPATQLAGYVPDGMTPEQYRQMKEKEREAAKQKKLGAYGPQSFKSRSLQSFQKDMEKGKAGHLMPVLNAQQLLKAGKIKQEDIPYMQRLGSWDDSDIGKKKKWSETDKKYDANQRPSGMDWMGRSTPTGPKANQAKKQAAPSPPKKMFGLF